MKKIENIFKILLVLTILICPITSFALTKNESVFTVLNSDGSLDKTTVTNHLIVKSKEEIEDESILEDIINVNGVETFKKEGNTLKWKANGNDIYYQGTSKKEMPIDVKIDYYLNDKKKDVKDIVGKKGDIKIKITLSNKLKNVVKINNVEEEIYTPFVVMAGSIIDTKNNSNINVTNGKVVETGNKSIISSLASPGLYESLNINKSDLNEIEISYKTTKFELNNIYIIATPKLIDEKELDLFDNVDNLVKNIDALKSSMDIIENGAKDLNDGVNSAYNGTKTIKNKVEESLKVSDNSEVLDEKTLNYIKENAMNGATLSDNELNKIASVASQSVSLTQEQLNQISNMVVSSLGTITLSEEQKALIISTVDNYIDNQYSQIIKSSARNSVDTMFSNINLSVTKEQIIQTSNYMVDEEVANTIATNLNNVLSTNLNNVKNQIYLISEESSLNSAKQIAESSALLAAENAANSTASTLAPIVATQTAVKVAPIVAGETAKKVASETAITVAGEVAPNVALQVATSVKNEASKKIASSMTSLNNGLNDLSNGLSKLNDGSNSLLSGISKFNQEGIGSLNNYSKKIKNYTSKAEALVDLSKSYSGYSSNNSNETIFINKVKSEK